MAKKQSLRKPDQSFCLDGDLYPDAPTLCFGLFRPEGEKTSLLRDAMCVCGGDGGGEGRQARGADTSQLSGQ